MHPWVLWGLPASLALAVALAGLGNGAEIEDASREVEGNFSKEDLDSLRLSKVAHRQKNKSVAYRIGSLSALSRGLMKNLNQPSRDESTESGSNSKPELPRSHTVPVDHGRPGAYSPMRRMQESLGLWGGGQSGSSSGPNGSGHQPLSATPDGSHGCCKSNDATLAEPPGGKAGGRGDHTSKGGSSKRPWRPILDPKTPNLRPPWKKEDGRPPSRPRGAI